MNRISPQRRRVSLALVLAVLLAPSLTSCATTTSSDKRILQYLNQEGFGKRYTGNSQDQNYVTIGDGIQFEDSYNPEVRGTETVDVDGTIRIPEAGSVFVAGMTRAELESFLTQRLSPYYVQTDVKVDIRAGGTRAYYVMGEVSSPGRKKFRGDVTVFEAVLEAIPNKHSANLGRVKLIRADPRNPLVIPIDVADMWQNGDSTYNVNVQEYDIIYVPPTFLQQLADIVSAIIIPVVTPLRTIFQTIFLVENDGRIGTGRYSRF